MTWNYRLMRSYPKTGTDFDEPFVSVREVYYDEDGRITQWTVEPVSPVGSTHEEFLEQLKRWLMGANSPSTQILDEQELEQECAQRAAKEGNDVA